ncbi:MAG: PilW family protein [Pseudomonas sp.]|nr:PilW family protein [Pseudomonas sp.]
MKTLLIEVQSKQCRPYGDCPQSGFSLIELMVAMVVSLLIMGAVLTLFLDVTRTNDEMAKTNIQIENGRFAIQLLQSDLSHGGFWDGYVPQFDDLTLTTVASDAPTSVPNPCLAYSDADWTTEYKNNVLGIPVQAYDDAPTGCTTASPAIGTDIKANTDFLVVRHAETCVAGVGGCENTAGKVYFQTSSCSTLPETAYSYVLDTDDHDLRQMDCATAADRRKFVSNIYYIRDDDTLMRSQFDLKDGDNEHLSAQPMIEGVEGFRVELGIDDGPVDGAPDTYVRCPLADISADTTAPSTHPAATVCTEDQLANVVAVKVYVLVRSLTATPGYTDGKTYSLGTTTLGPFNDNFKRHVFSSTVRLNNISGRREAP